MAVASLVCLSLHRDAPQQAVRRPLAAFAARSEFIDGTVPTPHCLLLRQKRCAPRRRLSRKEQHEPWWLAPAVNYGSCPSCNIIDRRQLAMCSEHGSTAHPAHWSSEKTNRLTIILNVASKV